MNEDKYYEIDEIRILYDYNWIYSKIYYIYISFVLKNLRKYSLLELLVKIKISFLFLYLKKNIYIWKIVIE